LSKGEGVPCIELVPGAPLREVPKKKDEGPPEGFIDNTVKCGRYLPDGSIEWYGTMPAFPEGWDTPLNPFKKKEQGEDTMSRASNLGPKRKDREEIMAKVRGLVAEGKAIAEAARILGVPVSTIYTWQYLERKQAQKAQEQAQGSTPEAQVGSQEPVMEAEPAETSITPEETEKVTPPKNDGFGPEDDDPIPCVPVPLEDLIAELREDLDLERKKVANLEKKMDLLTSALSAAASKKATSPETRLEKLLVAVFRELEAGVSAKE